MTRAVGNRRQCGRTVILSMLLVLAIITAGLAFLQQHPGLGFTFVGWLLAARRRRRADRESSSGTDHSSHWSRRISPCCVVAESVAAGADLGLVVAGDVIYNGVHMWLGESMVVGGFGPWRGAIDTVEALAPRHIVAGHQNDRLHDDAARTIVETRQYLDDADELLRTEKTAVDFFNAKIERYPDHLGRTVLWAGARRSTACASTRERTSGRSLSRAGSEPRRRRRNGGAERIEAPAWPGRTAGSSIPRSRGPGPWWPP
jgi:hypothetical protein